MAIKDYFGGIGVGVATPFQSPSDLYNHAQQAQQAQQAISWAQAQGLTQQALTDLNGPSIHTKATQLLKLRLAGLDSRFHISLDEFLACHVANGTVYIFFVIDGKAGHIEEETALFPSDKLVTQFRLIR